MDKRKEAMEAARKEYYRRLPQSMMAHWSSSTCYYCTKKALDIVLGKK